MSLYGDGIYNAGLYDDAIPEYTYGYGDYGTGAYGDDVPLDPHTYGYGNYGDDAYGDAPSSVMDSIRVLATTSVCRIGLKSTTSSTTVLMTAVRVPAAANPIVTSSSTILSPVVTSK